MSFVHLHLHSQYSLLDGANRLDDVLAAAKDAGMPAMALTDHGNMFGAIDFYNRARAHGIKPIIGIEAYVARGDRRERTAENARNNHLVLLARNQTGYRNLIKLTSRSYLDGFYYKPRVDKELLAQHAEGVTALSACLKGEINETILSNQTEEAEAKAREYADLFGKENYFLELQDHGIPDQQRANEILRDISRRTGIGMVVTNDCHYLRQDDSFAHDVLLCVGTQRALSDPDRLRYASDQFYLKSLDEMSRTFPGDAAAIDNTLAIAERCALEIDTGSFHLPEFPVPDDESIESYLERQSWDGLERRFEEIARRHGGREIDRDLYRERLRRELDIIQRMGFAGYFLIVWDFIRYAGQESIPVGPGRGSAAGSLVAYALRITDIDPLQYQLLFERFLNPERVSLPDIDIDFCMRRRGDVIQYVANKYGRDHVAQIITFGTLAAKAVVRDVGRVMGLPYAKVDRVAKLIPDMTRSLAKAAKEVDELAAEVANDPEVSQIVQVGSRLEGLTRHASLHAAAVVIAPQPIEELVPLYKTSKDEIVTQWDKDVIEDLGFLKMDFLGLRTLTVIDDTLRLLRHQGVELDLDEVPLDDEETFRLFCEGRTSGVFQFESTGMKDLLRRATPSRFEDLAAMNALYRPGALSVGMVEEYIHRKLGKRKVSYVIPETAEILEETYGIIAYQEQVMQIAVEIAGFSMGEADVLRKAMGKKSPEVMAKQKQKFVDGASERGYDAGKAASLWEFIEPFAGYGFNKSHSVAYAMLAYKTAYLKAHHPVPFMAAMLTSEMSSKDNVAKYISECSEMGIPVRPPDVNESDWSFSVHGDSVRFGLGAVKGVGDAAVEAVLAARRRLGRFESLVQFACEIDPGCMNQRVFEALVKSGSFDSFGMSRQALLMALPDVVGYAQRKWREAEIGQETLFGGGAQMEPRLDTGISEWPERERLAYEKEALGFYLTGNPLAEHADQLRAMATHSISDLANEVDGSVIIGGLVTTLKRVTIKSGPNAGRIMGRFVLEDLGGRLQVAVFADTMQRYGGLLEEDAAVLVKGVVRDRGADPELTVEEIRSLDGMLGDVVTRVELVMSRPLGTRSALELRDLLTEGNGSVPVVFRVKLADCDVTITSGERYRIEPDDDLTRSIEAILGPGCVQCRMERASPTVH